ncbi:hypothetical protein NM688_g2988 [Phlebia brevispora]|uniref:Uncharacterized protein n=1 Tax=Phlebia brevispora TaxID=194682 RepID=A0ACC1T6Z1_9APHY|nr:hypothetical protein NM688_g2988 [Phlebia brevispora]
MPPKNYRTVLCKCSTCILNEFEDETGEKRHGIYQLPRVARKHEQQDILHNTQGECLVKRQKIETGDQECLEERIFLASALSQEPLNTELPICSRDKDLDVEMEDASSRTSTRQARNAATSCVPTGDENMSDFSAIQGQETDNREDLDAAFRTISVLQSELCRKSRHLPQPSALVFLQQPAAISDPPRPLHLSHYQNVDLVALEDWLRGNREFIEMMDPLGNRDLLGRIAALKRDFTETERRIQSIKVIAWEQAKAHSGLLSLRDEQSPLVYNADRWFKSREYTQPFLLVALLLAIVLHALATISRLQISYVLATIKVIIYGAFAYNSTPSANSLTPAQLNLLNAIPIDIRTALKNLDIEPEYTLYACCQRCLALYRPNRSSPRDPYPHTCTHRTTPDDPVCEAELVRQNSDGAWVPLKTFALQSLCAWLAQLLSRPGIEKFLETSWIPSSHEPGVWTDIMEAPALQEFIGPDGHTLFSHQLHGSLNLVFSLFVDWFNPFGNKTAEKSHSVGAVYLVCLNLPPQLRYRMENVFLAGIIPGPHELSLEQLNHFLAPLVDEMLTLWHRGVYLSRTAVCITGRLIKAAIIPLMCDLPALRKVAGFAAFSSKQHFCSFCRLPKTEINNLDRPTWHQRSWAEHLDIATQWRDASTSKEREDIFEMHGLRWSELLRLPYWDPTRYALVDSMHNLYLGELRHHCREVLGIDVKDKSPDTKKQKPHPPEEQAENLIKVINAIKNNSSSALKSIRKGYISAVADLNGVVPEGTTFCKKDYIEALLAWYPLHQGEILVPPVLEESTTHFHGDTLKDWSKVQLLDNELLQEIRADIKKTFTPSWVEPAPSNFGSLSHGKLKVAQWRSVCTINLVITLICIWRGGGMGSTKRKRQILNNLVDLILAVEFATRRSMSYALAASYDAHIYRYLNDLHIIFEHDLLPNHHLSLHLRECMELFGPLKSNNKSGDMPVTFLHYFCIGSTIRSLMSSLKWPDIKYFRDMVTTYHAAFGNTLRGIFTGAAQEHAPFEYNPRAECTLDKPIYVALLEKLNFSGNATYFSCFTPLPGAFGVTLNDQAQFVKTVVLEDTGLIFSTSKRSCRNSFVLFKDEHGAQWPGQINSIFYHRRVDQESQSLVVEPFYVVNIFEALNDSHAALDPYRVFHGLNTSLFYRRTLRQSVILRQSDIISHFAAYFYTPDNIQEECVVLIAWHSMALNDGLALNTDDYQILRGQLDTLESRLEDVESFLQTDRPSSRGDSCAETQNPSISHPESEDKLATLSLQILRNRIQAIEMTVYNTYQVVADLEERWVPVEDKQHEMGERLSELLQDIAALSESLSEHLHECAAGTQFYETSSVSSTQASLHTTLNYTSVLKSLRFPLVPSLLILRLARRQKRWAVPTALDQVCLFVYGRWATGVVSMFRPLELGCICFSAVLFMAKRSGNLIT